MKKFIVIIVLFCAVLGFGSVFAQNIMYNPDFDINSPGVKIIIVGPPGIFTLPGSQTTNFIQVCSLGQALNLILDIPGKNMIRFDDDLLNMCDNETIENLDSYFQMENVGEVSVDSESLPYLKDASAEITMRNLPFEAEPDIEVDGQLATEKDIEAKQWDGESKTLTFHAKHFSTYRAIEASAGNVVNAENDVAKAENEQKSSLSIINIIKVLLVLVVVVILLCFLIKSLKNKK